MRKQSNAEDFDKIYKDTYKNTLKYIVLHCDNLDDVNDLLQDTYLETYKHFKKQKIESVSAYIIGVAKNILRKYYRFKKVSKNISISDYEIETDINSDIDIEFQFITKDNVDKVWDYIKRKDMKIAKIFYCYYHLDMKISEIASIMELNESTTKSYIYRTLKELQKKFNKEDNSDA